MSLKNLLLFIVVSLIVSSLLITSYHFLYNKSKVGFVRTGEVINAFNGFKKAQSQFEKDFAIVQGNADTLRKRIQALQSNNALKLKSSKDWAYQLGVAENEFMQYQKNSESQLQNRQQELSRDAVDKINLYIQDYGKQKGYKLILGSTENGSILYGQDSDDLTTIILEGLNKKYPADSLK